MARFNVYLNGKRIDTVYALDSLKPDDLKKSLVEKDGYDFRIAVTKDRHYSSSSSSIQK